MKKTLVALAVLAASSASFAQVTISGKLGFSFQKNAVIGDRNGSGMTMSDGDVIFGVTENLGNGMSIRAETAVQLRGRSDATPSTTAINGDVFRPRNATLTLTTPFGQITGGAIESPSGFFRVTSYKDDFATGFDGAGVWDAKANIDFVRFAAPIGKTGITASVWYTEVGSGPGNGTNFGAATTVNSTKVTAPVLMATYAAGPLSGFIDYTAFSAEKIAGGVGVNSQFDGLNRTRVGVDYNFGVARVAASYQTRNNSLADQYAIGVTVPMGATTFHLTYGARDEQKADAAFGFARADARTGTAFQIIHSMSKTTSLQFNYATYTGFSNLDNEYRATLFQRF